MPPERDDTIDADAIRERAEQAFGRLNGGPLPRHTDVQQLHDQLGKALRALVNDLVAKDLLDDSTRPAVAEALHWLDMPIGDGLQSAADCTRHLAEVTVIVSRMHRRMATRP